MDLSHPAAAVTLNDGARMPALGLGVYMIPAGGPCRNAVARALDSGYRHVDTAALYGNERDVGEAVRASGLPRDAVFVTTKLWNADQGHARALAACERSLDRLGLETIDLYLLHWPEPVLRMDSWRALVELRRRGRCRSIGVSNYTVAHLRELIDRSDVLPAVNQVEFSPFLHQRELLAFCSGHGIRLVAYCPLTRGERLGHPAVRSIAARHARTPAQVLLRWALQHGVAVIPKSADPGRIAENAALFDFALDAADMARLDRLDEGLRTCWDPTAVP